MKSLVLIGMPSSGKTTIGRCIADKIGFKFLDTDILINKQINMPIADYINKYGENQFRIIESEVIKNCSKLKNVVVATGGGAVKNIDNFDYYDRKKFSIVYIKRNVDTLKISSDRPLSDTKDKMYKLYKERKHLYESIADYTIFSESIYDTTIKIIKHLKR